jgi:hypothetical protein
VPPAKARPRVTERRDAMYFAGRKVKKAAVKTTAPQAN